VTANEERVPEKEANVYSLYSGTSSLYYETASSLASGTREGAIVLNFHSLSSFLLSTTFDYIHTQLKIYAMFNALDDIEIRYKSLGTVICEDEQDKEYDTASVTAFLTCGVLIPFIVSFLMVMMIWSSRAKIVPALNKKQNHANLAALVLTGLLFSTFVVMLDFVALELVVQGKHEFTKHSDFGKVSSLYFVIITTVFDAAIVLAAYFMLFCLGCLVRCRKEHKPTCRQWMLASICIAPLFCIASHSGYIIVAWVSDTKHAGPVTFAYIISFFYYFIIFRQLYIILSKTKLTARFELYCCCYFQKAYRSLVQRQWGQKKQPSELKYLPSEGGKSDQPDSLESQGNPSVQEEGPSDREESTERLVPDVSIKGKGDKSESDAQATAVRNGREETPDDSQSTSTFNFTAFFMEIYLGVIPVGAHIFVIYSIVAIPVSLTDAPTDIYHIIQLAFIIGTGLFTYKLIYTEDEPKQFTKSFVKYLQKKDLKDLGLNQLQDAEAAGKVVGKVAYTIMEQNTITNNENVCRANTEETNTHDTGQAQTSL